MNHGSNRSSSNGTQATSQNGQDKETEDGTTKFTVEQDNKIKSMKNAGNTWKEIATAVGSTKHGVRDRFRELTDPDNEIGEKKKNGAADSGNKTGTNGNKKDDYIVTSNSSGWTTNQDEKIKAMKAEKKTWKEIAHEVGATKTDVQSRFKELNQAGNSCSGGSFGADIQNNLNGVAAEVTNDLGIDFSGLFTDENWGNQGGSGWGKPFQEEKPEEKAAAAATNKDGKKKKSKKQSADNTSSKNEQTATQSNNHSGSHVNTDNDNYQGGSDGCRLKPDYHWTASDVDILDQLEAQHKAHKWLRLQADFYNCTGRMVPASLIEQKFRDDGVI